MTEIREEFLAIISRVYRTLLALTGSESQAETLTIEMLSPIASRLLRVRNPRQFELWLAKTLLNRTSIGSSTNSETAIGEGASSSQVCSSETDPFLFISSLPMEVRVWAALRLGNHSSHRIASEVLSLTQRESTALDDRFHKAIVEGQSHEREISPAHIASALSQGIQKKQIPENVILQATEVINSTENQQKKKSLKVFRPALLAATCSLLIALGLIGQQIWKKIYRFSGSEKVERLLAKSGAMSAKQFDDIDPGPHGLTDWLFVVKGNGLPGSPQNQTSFVKVSLSKARLFEFEDALVAECLNEDETVVVLLFSASQLGVTLDKEREWYPLSANGWEGAVRREGDGCLLAATTQGRKYLESLIANTPSNLSTTSPRDGQAQ